jgi:hypothetical protein
MSEIFCKEQTNNLHPSRLFDIEGKTVMSLEIEGKDNML